MAEGAGRSLPGFPRKFYEGLVEDLIAFAEHEFWLVQPIEGASRREHFLSAERQGMPSPYLKGPALPDALAYLWRDFQDIHGGRSQTGMGPSRATHLDILAWQWNARVRLAGWELKAVQALGIAWLAAQDKSPHSDLPPRMRPDRESR